MPAGTWGDGPRGGHCFRTLRESGRTVAADGLYPLDTSGIDAADVRAAEAGERASILKYDGGLSEDESRREGRGGSVGRATAREIKTLSQALEARGKPKFPLGSRPLGKDFEGVGGGTGPAPPALLDRYIYFPQTVPIFQKQLLLWDRESQKIGGPKNLAAFFEKRQSNLQP